MDYFILLRCRHHSRFNSQHNLRGTYDQLKRKKERKNVHFSLVFATLNLHLYSIAETRIEHLRNHPQLLTRRENSWSNPTAKAVYRLGSAHNLIFYDWENSLLDFNLTNWRLHSQEWFQGLGRINYRDKPYSIKVIPKTSSNENARGTSVMVSATSLCEPYVSSD